MSWLSSIFRYLWALPYSLLGFSIGWTLLITGGEVRFRDGTLGFYGGWIPNLLVKFPRIGYVAITLGHVILARDVNWLESTHTHEMVHVRQFERWGILMGPAYGIASIVAGLQGKRWYRDNVFEIEAYDNS